MKLRDPLGAKSGPFVEIEYGWRFENWVVKIQNQLVKSVKSIKTISVDRLAVQKTFTIVKVKYPLAKS
ncbi:hypothetical protein A2697_01395 [Candidatus Curtissbacteria bacterium RIFCSPHIGHO2_01_FULL_41_44]|uniref:Uncharacterized protein n=1 Tax=Candidatus Curtissbacteria bacterium RIFCSPLOWO2_01_FULL_42_50 TaxID=1797730 RepID=A0A1F5H3H8_9BACT|nr:MAG: hypothetical protein A3C33_00610 [Candidatus Curtissbacteria bacterium RIFCSPHIGHO2_02_FULL_42_58]OGD94564.1 MAG: hypothetical protein A2697_01395 [Candidatus Curtissbacteria bacterium RIFCSPHIGHO2_01_FULL_41_44]OGD97947.1 MAG: hypothetical protein A3E71_03870 [Candidatus Curtissbacteria bacterium RIFCSPHIGHO2_12_FULL_42_33]OGD98597.1 MAG: hypothetical protein A3B54_05440 [Candidatus Curtissbacteria bacterium RIFCSPLOWO2_01_FULL_42_50]OGE11200.1 MAG: hypothetical protein A3H87_01515 [Ca